MKKTDVYDLVIYFDGAVSNNGRGNESAGIAIVVINPISQEVYAKESLYIGHASNNEAEWEALLLALQFLYQFYYDTDSYGKVLILGDSRLVINQINDRWKIKKSGFRRLYDACKRLIKTLNEDDIYVEIKWIPSKENLADSLAKHMSRPSLDNHFKRHIR
jgi:ribonuclease HI